MQMYVLLYANVCTGKYSVVGKVDNHQIDHYPAGSVVCTILKAVSHSFTWMLACTLSQDMYYNMYM